MKDKHVNWRNLRWSYDADYTERGNVPLLAQLITIHGSMFDETFVYLFQGKAKQYVVRYPHYNTPRANYRIPTEKYRAPNPNRKLNEFLTKEAE